MKIAPVHTQGLKEIHLIRSGIKMFILCYIEKLRYVPLWYILLIRIVSHILKYVWYLHQQPHHHGYNIMVLLVCILKTWWIIHWTTTTSSTKRSNNFIPSDDFIWWLRWKISFEIGDWYINFIQIFYNATLLLYAVCTLSALCSSFVLQYSFSVYHVSSLFP